MHSHEECLYNKKFQAENFKHIEEESNKKHAQTILQKSRQSIYCGKSALLLQLTTEEVDATYDLPYTREPHPKYKGKVIPAYEMIKFSVNIHRGCFGGCSFLYNIGSSR